MATAPSKLWTIDDLADLPADGRHEIWGGELVEMAAAGYRHSVIAGRIVTSINVFAWSASLGNASGADGGYVIAHDPLTLFIPDVAFVRAERLPENDEGILDLVPDLVVEVVSPTDRAREIAEKIGVYRAAGVSIIWVVYPEQRMVDIYRADQPNVIHQAHEGDELNGGDILPGFRLPVADIFPKR